MRRLWGGFAGDIRYPEDRAEKEDCRLDSKVAEQGEVLLAIATTTKQGKYKTARVNVL